MGTARIRLGVNKMTSFLDAIDAAFADLTPLSGQAGGRVQAMIPVGSGAGKVLEVASGDWLVQARLPSGEVVTERVSVGDGQEVAPTLRASDSSRETRSWPTSLSYAAATFDATRRTQHPTAVRREFPHLAQAFARAEKRLEAEPFELLVRDKGPEAPLQPSNDWGAVGRVGNDLTFDATRFSLATGARAFIQLRDRSHVLSLPLPWYGGEQTYVQVQAVPDLQGEGGELTLKAFVLDPHLAPVIAFLDASDMAAARMLAPETARFAERMLQGKRRNPLAAAAGALALLLLREYRLLHHWPLNLAAWFEWLPDGAAIAAWCTLKLGMGAGGERLEPSARAPAALAHVHAAAARGAPYFSRSVSLLHEVCLLLQHSESGARVHEDVAAWVTLLHQAVKPDSFVAAYEGATIDGANQLLAGVAPPPPQAPPPPAQPRAPQAPAKPPPPPVNLLGTGLPDVNSARPRPSATSSKRRAGKVKKGGVKRTPQRRASSTAERAARIVKSPGAVTHEATRAKAAKNKGATGKSGRAGGARRDPT